MRQFYYDNKNNGKQECEICGKLCNFKYMRTEHTVDGDLLICNGCYNNLKKETKIASEEHKKIKRE